MHNILYLRLLNPSTIRFMSLHSFTKSGERASIARRMFITAIQTTRRKGLNYFTLANTLDMHSNLCGSVISPFKSFEIYSNTENLTFYLNDFLYQPYQVWVFCKVLYLVWFLISLFSLIYSIHRIRLVIFAVIAPPYAAQY